MFTKGMSIWAAFEGLEKSYLKRPFLSWELTRSQTRQGRIFQAGRTASIERSRVTAA